MSDHDFSGIGPDCDCPAQPYRHRHVGSNAPMTAPLSPAQAEHLARVEASPSAPEANDDALWAALSDLIPCNDYGDCGDECECAEGELRLAVMRLVLAERVHHADCGEDEDCCDRTTRRARLVNEAAVICTPAADAPAGCVCGHSFEKHLGYVGLRQDPCAGGTPGFCGCTGYVAAPAAAGTWRHFRWHEPHEAVPVPGTEYPDPSGKTGARCANCPDGEAIGFAPAAAADTQGGGR